MKDIYDEAIECLEKAVAEGRYRYVHDAWSRPFRNIGQGGCLFLYATASGNNVDTVDEDCGCLTQIRSQGSIATTPSLTERILHDARIPKDVPSLYDYVTEDRGEDQFNAAIKEFVKTLPVFAEWQRIIDAELGRDVKKLWPGAFQTVSVAMESTEEVHGV